MGTKKLDELRKALARADIDVTIIEAACDECGKEIASPVLAPDGNTYCYRCCPRAYERVAPTEGRCG